ncbi:MAG TPA: hypothetical protein VFM02_03935 [Candidatus Paceibacterota bacterium]|nr:hypothetical protein [Candidatus Paceibacterota bacterium]
MDEENEKSRIEGFEEKLYSKNKIPEPKRSQLLPKKYDIPRDFESSEEETAEEVSPLGPSPSATVLPKAKKAALKKEYLGSSPFRKLLFFSLIFFVIAGGVAGVMFLANSDAISTKNVQMTVIGPETAKAGDKDLFQISITNRNQVPISNAYLMMTFPDGTRKAEDLTQTITDYQQQLGNIGTGETKNTQVEVALFGNANDQLPIDLTLEYNLQNSKVSFVKKMTHTVEITSSPVVLSVNLLRASASDQHVELDLTVNSNSDTTINDLVAEAQYPVGFTFVSSVPAASSGSNIWDLGTIEPGEQKTIKINGILSGESTEKKIFRFQAGLSKDPTAGVQVPYALAQANTTIEAPFVLADIAISDMDDKTDAVDPKNKTVGGTVSWKNNSGERLTNMKMNLALSGDIVNRETVQSESGFFQSSDDTILWDPRTTKNLSEVLEGASGQLPFHFDIYDPFSPETAMIHNPTVTMNVSMQADRLSEAGAVDELQAYVTKKIKIDTVVKFAAYALYNGSPFQNSGPLPPVVGQQTTYTIFWTLKNSFNDVNGAIVTAKLPPYMQWIGSFTPQKENIEYNSHTGTVTWHVGKLDAGTGIQTPDREVAFQVAFQPSLSQLGETPNILLDSNFQGTDAFTGAALDQTVLPVTTRLTEDPNFNNDALSKVTQ